MSSDDGPDGLIPFIQNCGFPVLGANLNMKSHVNLGDFIKKSTIGKYS